MSSDFQVSPQERSAPQAISPIIMPSVAPVVSAPSSSAAAEAVGPSEGNSKHEESATSGGTAEPSQTCVSKPPSGPSAEEQWIKVSQLPSTQQSHHPSVLTGRPHLSLDRSWESWFLPLSRLASASVDSASLCTSTRQSV